MEESQSLILTPRIFLQQYPKVEILINEFLADCDVRANSKETYRTGLLNYFRWICDNKIDFNSITNTEILRYKDWLGRDLEKMTSSTAGTYLIAVKQFYKWTEATKKYPNVAADVKLPKSIKKFVKHPLTEEQTRQLLRYFRDAGNKRNYALIMFLIGTACRTIEARRANVGDIEMLHGKRIIRVHGKGRSDKKDFVVLIDNIYAALVEYWKERGEVKLIDPIFVSQSKQNKGERLSTQIISYIAKDGMKAIGIDDKSYTAHSLRHSGAVLMLRRGAKMERVQGVLRHHSIETTQIYTSVFDEEQRILDAPEELLSDIF